MDRAVARRSPWRRRALWGAAVAAGLGAALVFARGGSARTLAVGADRISLAPVTRGAFEDFVQLRGEVAQARAVVRRQSVGRRIAIEVGLGGPALEVDDVADPGGGVDEPAVA